MNNAPQSIAHETQLSDLFASVRAMLRRRWLTLALVTFGVMALAAVIIAIMTPKYEATTQIRIDPSLNPLATAQQGQASLGSEAMETEVSVFNSPELARNVVSRLKLQNDPEFTRALDNSKLGPLTPDARLNAVAQILLKKIRVGRDKLTYIIAVTAESENPAKAARLANTIAETYLDTRVGNSIGTAERQSAFFKEQLSTLEKEARDADAAVAQYQARAGIVEGGSAGTITDQQVGPLSSQLAEAESQAAAARANLVAARRQIASGGMDAVSEVRNSNVISDLRRQRAEILRNMGEILSRYGEKHPESRRVREQLVTIDAQIDAEATRAIGTLEAVASAADARASSLRGAMQGLESRQARNTRAAVTAQSLQREAETKRDNYQKMSEMALQSNQSSRNSIAQGEIVDRAQTPIRPVSPNRPLLASLATIMALALGFITITVQEMVAGGLRSISDIEGGFGIPVLSALPKLKGKGLFGRNTVSPADLIVENPTSLYAESLRNARASIIGVKASGQSKVIAFTSSVPEEGKTTTALAFSRILAMNSAPTILIDCDLRRAALQKLVGCQTEADIVDVLHRGKNIDHAIGHDIVPGLDIITVKTPFYTAQDLFDGGALEKMLNQLRQRYTYIILDLPPILGMADGRAIAAQADAVAVMVKWGSTPSSAFESTLAALKGDGSNIVGAIYSMVDPTAEAIGGQYYSKKYSGYYQPS